MEKKLKETELRQYATRLAAPGKPDAGLAKDLLALKAVHRYEIASALATWPVGDERREDGQFAIAEVIPAFLGEDYLKSVKPDAAARRLAAVVKAARRLAGAPGEAKVLLVFIERATAPIEAPQRGSIDPELIVGAARLERPSGHALSRVLESERHLKFAGLELWARLATISASVDSLSGESADMARAIDRLYTLLGPATNIVPVELRVLRRAMSAARDAVAAPGPTTPAAATPKADVSPVRDVLDLLREVDEAIREERKRQKSGGPNLERKLEQCNAELGQLRIEQTRERDERQKSEERVRVLEQEQEWARQSVEQARRERDAAKVEIEAAQRDAQNLEKRLHEAEALLNAAAATALRTVQRRLREQCHVPLQELGQYISKATAGGDFDMAKLVRSYERFEKVFRRLSTLDSEKPGQSDSDDSAKNAPDGRDAT
jgi:hypothetical protein